jgi:hypothetical protein
MPEPGLEILGKRLGSWKVLLPQSTQEHPELRTLWLSLFPLPMPSRPLALTDRSGNVAPIEEKLRDLASGSWSCHVAGTEQQRKKLRVPLATTRCNSQFLVLWQIDVALDDTTQTESQLVKVWEVGTKTEISPVIDCIVLLQKSYSIEHVARCRQKPQEDAGRKFFPTLFHGSPDAAEPGARGQGLDIRTVDREVLEMANRFYTLTEPMVRSALANDLCEEFPFEFSGDRTRIILFRSIIGPIDSIYCRVKNLIKPA